MGRITAIEKAVDGLVTESKGIRLEWENVYDKLNRTMGRLNARARRDAAQEPVSEDNGAEPVPQMPVGTHALLKAARERRS